MFSHTRTQRLTACIAILAVLLLFVAPVVSKNLMERQTVSPASHMMMSDKMMSDDMSEVQHHDSAMMMPGHTMTADEGFACGYCALLVHVPLMIWSFVPVICLMMVISRAPPPPRILEPLCRRAIPVFRPRAPPRLLRFLL